MEIRRNVFEAEDPNEPEKICRRLAEVVVTMDKIELWACDQAGNLKGILYSAPLDVWAIQNMMWTPDQQYPRAESVEYKEDGEIIYRGRWK